MNKPEGYVCSSVSDSHKTVYELLSPALQSLVKSPKRGERLHTAGRLDCETSGLLFLTTDGYFSDYLTRSQNKITKTYYFELETPVPALEQPRVVELFASGLILPPEKKYGEQRALPADLEFCGENAGRVRVREGKFHEVRRLFMAVGNKVTYLKRTAIGAFELPENLKKGDYTNVLLADLKSYDLYCSK